MELLCAANRDLQNTISQLLNASSNTDETTNYSYVLNCLLAAAIKHRNAKGKTGHRHQSSIKGFACYIFMLGGRLCYETLYFNLPLPSPTSIGRYLHDNGPEFVEGVMRCSQLKKYLEDRKLPMTVWISEDGTRITGRLQYDPGTNQIVGLLLPLDKNGMPIAKSFLATSAKAMNDQVSLNKVTCTAYTVMVQPLCLNAEPFCLQLFGTDNQFQYSDVINRQRFTRNELKKHGIDTLGFSGDGDPKLLKSMKIQSGLGLSTSCAEDFVEWKWFHCSLGSYFFIQDIIHIATKLRNRLLNPSIELPFGKYLINAFHLQYLIENVDKDKHLLTATDINPKDRQNFNGLVKVMQPQVRCLLKENVPDSYGTVLYLTLCDFIVAAFRDPELSPLERVYKIWYCVFVLRGWRIFIQKSKNYTLQKNFITSNAFTCIELNAHSLVQVMIYLRKIEKPEWFIPILMSSQPCEEFFRKLRSFTSTYMTQVNFSMLQVMQRIKKIQLQGEIILNNKENIKFPRLESNLKTVNLHELPANKEIFDEIEKARKDAIATLNSMNIKIEMEHATKDSESKSKSVKRQSKKKPSKEAENKVVHIRENELNDCGVDIENDDDLIDHEEDDFEIEVENCESNVEVDEDLYEDLNKISSLTGELMLKDYNDSHDTLPISKKIPFTKVQDSTGKTKVVRKSTLLDILVSRPEKLSNDRLERVKISEINSRIACLKVTKPTVPTLVSENQFFRKQEEITIGEWCLFHVEEQLLIGLIVGFKYLSGKTIKDTKYTRQTVQVKSPEGVTPRGIGVLATWHKLVRESTSPCTFSEIRNADSSSEITTFNEFLNINNYIGTVEKPKFSNDELKLKSFPVSAVLQISSYLKKDVTQQIREKIKSNTGSEKSKVNLTKNQIKKRPVKNQAATKKVTQRRLTKTSQKTKIIKVKSPRKTQKRNLAKNRDNDLPKKTVKRRNSSARSSDGCTNKRAKI